MSFKKWLYNEIRHFLLEDNPIHLRIDGVNKRVTGIDFKWEDFGQARHAGMLFVQEFPHQVAEPGLCFVNAGMFDGYWIEHLHPGQLQKLRSSDSVMGDTDAKRLYLGAEQGSSKGRPMKMAVNPLNKFVRINHHDMKEEDTGAPATWRAPYNKKEFLHWWDFAEVSDGSNIIKQAARVRTY
jgi:hypothetical protein